ncbi:hypothetical protein HPULCUR_000219 [Helicostylum pulchrum]|uniref:Uncharacterized protein n=1 Tax=Helicostylum pulchrum TaxID=562976 RepID=A0ABP9XJ99_9FUNG
MIRHDEKRKAKRAKNSSSSSASTTSVCTSCKKTGHKSSRSSACKNHNINKKEILSMNLGKKYQPFTFKIPLDKCVKQEFLPRLKAFAISSSRDVREIVFRAQLFVNYYIVRRSNQQENNDLPRCIFRQQFCNNLPSDMLSVWDLFKAQHRTIMYNAVLRPGSSQCLTKACTELATSYHNRIVENFETRVIKFLTYKLQITFVNMDYATIKNIVQDYCYQLICKGNPKWPSNIIAQQGYLSEDAVKDRINQVTLLSLSAAPEKAYGCIKYILNQYEEEHSCHHTYDVRRLSLPRHFSLLPKPSLHWRFVIISANPLCPPLKITLPSRYEKQLQMFYRVFNLKVLRYHRIEKLMPNGENDILFGNIIRSDGFCVDFLFYRRIESKQDDTISIPNHNLELQDFTFEEVENTYRPRFIDPGRKSVFTAANGLGSSQHQVRRCEEGITVIESGIPTSKSLDTASFLSYAEYMLSHLDALFTFYGLQTAKIRFNLYQGRQRAPEYMVNMLLDGTAKKDKWRPTKLGEEDKNKVPLIIFGNGMFGKDLVKLKGDGGPSPYCRG